MLVAMEDARILARLLPIRSAPISRSRRLMRRWTNPARSSPLCSSVCIRARDAAVSAVSDPEKNAERMTQSRMMPHITQSSKAIRLILLFRFQTFFQKFQHGGRWHVLGNKGLAD